MANIKLDIKIKSNFSFLKKIEEFISLISWDSVSKNIDPYREDYIKDTYKLDLYDFFTTTEVKSKIVYSFDKENTLTKSESSLVFILSNENIFRITHYSNDEAFSEINFSNFDTFFFNLYKSIPNGLGYVSWVDVGNYYKFDSKYGLDKFEFYDSVFNEKPLFYHCVTTEEVYEEDHTKVQLLNCPFIKVEEWEDGSIEMLHYNNPLDIESDENIEQIRKVRKYLSENNLYSE
ncbi:hypothetical protein [Flammeovirga kamogawensis]|uniref:Uncharacterized protein n=1 Tax=Flammeovirga kamogawensis TaxID=373891 RepID=A0ABX8H296_9BACT|nr:hypothetical protein [Flammeovirga kamogawensis]MBB6463603.1 hypothetical protein [Flammeovirga kamogawensis]QWG09828.1 hypothetical protein KM029_19295 [Flammeovirga kamogawensis]TRX65335.1 hypothetical protein EO216_22695 [Flammeovirga kamogawensis]